MGRSAPLSRIQVQLDPAQYLMEEEERGEPCARGAHVAKAVAAARHLQQVSHSSERDRLKVPDRRSAID
eukprot:765762-Hanusia_phi.AAC.5